MSVVLSLLPRASHRGREIGAPRLRCLIALLASDLRTGCSTGRLVDGLWPEDRPENPAKALQVLVSRARAQLGSDVIASTPTGYRLALEDEQVDAAAILRRAADAARDAAAGDHAAALANAEAGLALWEGTAVDDAPDDALSALRRERIPAHRRLVRSRALALSRLDRPGEALDGLLGLAGEQPHDEEVLLELLRCEAATAGPAAALVRYDTHRRALRAELGADPGPALQALHRELLDGEVPTLRHGVRYDPNPLLGRDDDIAAVLGLLRTSRVTSIVGPGGLGKTRLAHAVGRRAVQRAVHVVPLAATTSAEDVAAEVASVLGVGESRLGGRGRMPGAAELLQGVLDALGAGPVLLVLDNCEHVVEAVADLVHALVAMTEQLRVLTTSRAPLGLSSEAVYALPELDLATTVELFRHRAHAARPGVDLPLADVTELCRHLDGLPLAVELAAARIRVLSVAEIARRLEDRFALLRGGPRDAPQRHRTLHAVVGWSWNLLDPSRQAAMRTLSVFPDGFLAAAAQHVLDRGGGGDGGGGDALAVLEDLVDQSMLKACDTPQGVRFRMLETVREFSAGRVQEAGEDDHAVRGFLAWARDFGLAHHEPPWGADPVGATDRIRAEQDNLAQALRIGITRGDGATVAAVTAVLSVLWLIDFNHARLMALAEETAWLLSHFRPGPELVEATRTAAAIAAAGVLMVEGPRAVRALVVLRRLPAARPDTLVRALAAVLVRARELQDPCGGVLAALCDAPEPLLAGVANGIASYERQHAGDGAGAIAAARRALAVFDHPATPWLAATAHSRLCELFMQDGGQGRAARHHLERAMLLDELGPAPAGVRWSLVLANLQLGDLDEAERWWKEASGSGEGSTGPLREDLATRAEILLSRGEVEAGLEMWRRTVQRLRDDGGTTLGLGPWLVEATAAAVVAHAHHGRLDLVGEIVHDLPRTLALVLGHDADPQPVYVVDLSLHGALVLALAMVDLDRGRRAGDRAAAVAGVRLVALAERFRFVRTFQPTMSPARARAAAEQAAGSAYAAAVAEYADLGRDELRDAALAVLRSRA